MPRRPGVMVRGSVLRARRESLGLSREALASMLQGTDYLAVGSIKNTEKGGPVAAETVRTLARYLGLPYLAVVRPEPEAMKRRIAEMGMAGRPAPKPWVGREAELEQLHQLLMKQAPPRCAVAGLPGVGKTALVSRLLASEDVQDRFPDGIAWVSPRGEPGQDRLNSLQMELAGALGFLEQLPALEPGDPRRRGAAFRHHLGRFEVLLVFDDLPSLGLLEQFVEEGMACGVLATTTQRDLASHFAPDLVMLQGLGRGESASLLGHHLSAERLAGDPEGLEDLLKVLRGLPRNLNIAGQVLRRETYTPLKSYAERVRADLAELVVPREMSEADLDTGRWSQVASLESLRPHILPEAWSLLGTLGLFAHDAFNIGLVAALAGLDEDRTARYLSELCNSFLVTPVSEEEGTCPTFCLEGPVQDYARWRLGPPPAQEPPAGLVQTALMEAQTLSRMPLDRRWRRFTGVRSFWSRVLGGLTAAVHARLAGSPEEAALRRREGGGGDVPEAAPLARLLLELGDLVTQSHVGEARAWLYTAFAASPGGVCLGHLGLMLGKQQYPDYAGAQVWFAWAAELLEREGALDLAATALTESGKMLHGVGKLQEALVPLSRALEVSRRAGQADDVLAVRGNNLAISHLILRESPASRYQQAEAVLEEAQAALGSGGGHRQAIRQVVAMNLTMARVLGSGGGGQGDRTVLASFRASLPDGSLSATYPTLSWAWLTGRSALTPESETMAWAREIWQGALDSDRSCMDRYLRHLSCVVSNLCGLREARQQALSGVLPGGVPGTVAIIDASYDFQELAENTGSMGLTYLIEPFELLFDEELLGRIRLFLEHAYGTEHVAYQRVSSLLGEGGAPGRGHCRQ